MFTVWCRDAHGVETEISKSSMPKHEAERSVDHLTVTHTGSETYGGYEFFVREAVRTDA